MEGGLEEGDQLREVEVPDRLMRPAPVYLGLDGMVEAEEVFAVLTGAMTCDGRSVRVALAFSKMHCDALGSRVDLDVAVPRHRRWIEVLAASRLQRKKLRRHTEEPNPRKDEESSHVLTPHLDAVVDEALDVRTAKSV